ncbi:FKBP-type peptidyl-prolyl cis-trans isomerase [Sphingomonas bacterium]|uniref:FKBP-type peptidyl-prolyl cis-trans isomerase n=1 Tax=Sphingomonas bacterium TaxID=1895847 RepID=UPI001576DDAD|nr:FKBP-type peptidyl-prolyl cis-trans isomerase [Sphingomonas bacterium]
MTTVTAVPLQPVKRGYLIWLWLGIALALVGAVALARAAPQGIRLTTLKAGHGKMPGATDVVLVSYTGKLTNGTVFDKSPQPVPFEVSGVVPGFAQGLKRMQKGGRYRLVIPPQLGYGVSPPPGALIPPNATLIFDVQLIDFRTQEEVRQMQMMQQMMQGQGAPSGVPH